MRVGRKKAVSATEPGFRVPLEITPFSQIGTPIEKTKWWAPFGWLLVAVCTLLTFALLTALSPFMLVYMGIRRVRVRRLTYRSPPEELRVAIVGAGWAALQCVQRFKTLGVTHIDVFERNDDIGGTWHPSLRYHGLQIHASMVVTSFDGYPYSTDRDIQHGKVMGDEVERYIHRFAQSHDLVRYCHFNSNVDSVSYRSSDRTGTLTIRDVRTGEVRESGPYDMVIWASMAAYGNIPRLEGSDAFQGQQIHTVQFKDTALQDIMDNGRRVVVVGGGKAAVDVVLGLKRAGYDNFMWVMRKPFLFYKYEVLLHNGTPLSKLRGLSYLSTVLWCAASKRVGAILHWSSGYICTFGKPHTDFKHFHGGVMCPTQRREVSQIPFVVGDPVRLTADRLVLRDGQELPCDVVIWATGNKSGIDTLKLEKDGEPFTLEPDAKLYNHFIVPEIPVLASSTALWTSFGPMRGTNAADLTVYHLCVRKEPSQERMERSARRQISANSIIHSFIWAHNSCWLQQWAFFHIDLMRQGITPVESFFRHALEVFVLGRETPLAFNILPPRSTSAVPRESAHAA